MDIRKTAFILSALLFFFNGLYASAQQTGDEPQNGQKVLLSGMVTEGDFSGPVANATVKNISGKFSTMADSTGFFTLSAMPGDTIMFEAMLYQPDIYIVPQGIGGSHFAVIEVLQKDALLLDEVTIRAFPSQEQFERAILEADPGNIADKTIMLDAHLERVTNDPANMQQYLLTYNRKYNRRQVTYLVPGVVQGNNFLNPQRWARFISDWREGRFDDDSREKLRGFPAQNQEEE